MVTITVSDHLCSITPWISDLATVLGYKKKVYKPISDYRADVQSAIEANRNPGRVQRFTLDPQDLYSLSEDKTTGYFLPGILARVRKRLQKIGVSWQEVDARDPNLYPQPAWERLTGELRGSQLQVLATISISQGGIIKAATGAGKSFMIKKLCQIYPRFNILIVTKRAAVVKTLFRDIEAEFPGQVGQIGAGSAVAASGKRIVVCTTKSLHKVNPEEVHMLLFDEAHAVGDNSVYQSLLPIVHCRRYGFSATPVRADGTGLLMEAFFGPVLCDIPYEEAAAQGVVTSIKYLMRDCPRGPRFIDDNVSEGRVSSDIFKKRYGYWRNSDRNEDIGEVFRLALGYDIQTLVMVETLEHAIILSEFFIPDVPVVHYGKNSTRDFLQLSKALQNHKGMAVKFNDYAQEAGIFVGGAKELPESELVRTAEQCRCGTYNEAGVFLPWGPADASANKDTLHLIYAGAEYLWSKYKLSEKDRKSNV